MPSTTDLGVPREYPFARTREATYEVYATRWDDPHIVEQVPAMDLTFSLPLSDHGEASFTAKVAAGGAFWRSALSLPMAGVLITRDTVPVWSGWVIGERQAGPRSFQFECREWGHFFEDKVPPTAPRTWTGENDHKIFRDLVTEAQAVSGQNAQVQVGATLGAHYSDRTINAWDDTTVGREFRAVADAEGGPEWYFGTAGDLANPVRQLVLLDRLGHITPQTTLEYVEDTMAYEEPSPPPLVVLLGDLYLGEPTLVEARRAGGNLIAQSRTQEVASAATVARGFGSGDAAATLIRSASSTTLLGAGWPRMTKTTSYSDITDAATLQRHVTADLAAAAGIASGYSLVAWDGEPDWTQTPRGSSVQVVLDTDVYGFERPVGGPAGFEARLVDLVVRVPNEARSQVEWRIASVLEV